VVSQEKKIAKVIDKMRKAGIPVSLFLDPDSRQLQVARKIGATFVELHTGKYCDAVSEDAQEAEYALIAAAAEEADSLGLRVCAGHGLNYHNTAAIAAIDVIEELSIGHAIVSRAVFSGMERAVRDMLAIIRQANMMA
jgi:pyridoxine 5-phosphate synthase